MSAHAERISRRRNATSGRPFGGLLARFAESSWLSLLIAGAVAAICFGAGGGLVLGPDTTVEIALTLAGGLLAAGACVLAVPGSGRLWGGGCAVAIFSLAAYSIASVAWSVAPDNSWIESNRTLAYAATFVGAVALVRLAGDRWRSMLAGLLLAIVAVCAYSLVAKMFPETLAASDTSSRLRAPFSYWNAVGLTAALGVPPCLWLASRRDGHGALAGLGVSGLTLLLVTLVLSYSRGALLAFGIGLAFWFVFVGLRLRGAAALAIAALGAAPVLLWSFGQAGLTKNGEPLVVRSATGHRLGLLLAAALVATLLLALLARFALERDPPSERARRRAGVALLVAVALVPLGGIGLLAASSRGLSGSITHAWNSVTSANGKVAASGPSRFTAASNDHALYWREGIDVFQAHPLLGTGAGSFPIAAARYRTSQAYAAQAHSYVVQTLSDLGLVGLALSLLLAGGWCLAVVRTTAGQRRAPRSAELEAERAGLLTLASCVVVFTVHSGVDWTWFVPGDAVIALLAAGWVAGRGPIAGAARAALALRRAPLAVAGASIAVALALVVAWSQWQPLRAADTTTSALTASGTQPARSVVLAHAAVAQDPLSLDARFALAAAQQAAGQATAARATLSEAVALQPSNADSWYQLASFDIAANHLRLALGELRPALYLDPQSKPDRTVYLAVLAEVQVQANRAAARAAARRRAQQQRSRSHSKRRG